MTVAARIDGHRRLRSAGRSAPAERTAPSNRMDEFTATSSAPLTNAIGLHARPSVKLTKLAKTFASQIEVAPRSERPMGGRQEHRQGHGGKGGEGHDPAFSRQGPRRARGAGGADAISWRSNFPVTRRIRQRRRARRSRMAELRFSGRAASGGFAGGPRRLAEERRSARCAAPASRPPRRRLCARAIASALEQLGGLAARRRKRRRRHPRVPDRDAGGRTLSEAAFGAIAAGAPADRAMANGARSAKSRTTKRPRTSISARAPATCGTSATGCSACFPARGRSRPAPGRDPRRRRSDAVAFSRDGLERRGRHRTDARQRLRPCRDPRAGARGADDRRARARSRRLAADGRGAHRRRKRYALPRSGASDARGFRRADASRASATARHDDFRTRPAFTADGTPIAVCVNIADPAEVDALDPASCDGIGLVRTEFLFSGKEGLPDEDTQYRAYRRLAEWAAGRPVTIRTLDAGGRQADRRPDSRA